jgi:hypothetical protein
MEMQRQGDILVIKGVTIPEGAEQIEGRVVARGELTGHNHEVESGTLYEKDGRLYLIADITTTLRHPEHGALTLEPDQYEIRRQLEAPNNWRHFSD